MGRRVSIPYSSGLLLLPFCVTLWQPQGVWFQSPIHRDFFCDQDPTVTRKYYSNWFQSPIHRDFFCYQPQKSPEYLLFDKFQSPIHRGCFSDQDRGLPGRAWEGHVSIPYSSGLLLLHVDKVLWYKIEYAFQSPIHRDFFCHMMLQLFDQQIIQSFNPLFIGAGFLSLARPIREHP